MAAHADAHAAVCDADRFFFTLLLQEDAEYLAAASAGIAADWREKV
jgi:hypothetical protein